MVGSGLAGFASPTILREGEDTRLLVYHGGGLSCIDFENALKDVKYQAWTVPVVANGKLYLRYLQTLVCYNLMPDQDIRFSHSSTTSTTTTE